MNISTNIIYIDDFSPDNGSRVVGQTIVPCNKIGNNTITIPIEGLNDSLEQIHSLKDNINKLTEENNSMLSRMTSLEADYHVALSQAHSLEENNQELLSQIDALREDEDELRAEMSALSVEKVELQNQINILEEANQNLQEDIPETGRLLYRVDMTVNGEIYTVVTRPVYNLDTVTFDYMADKYGIFLWELKHEEDGIYWYEFSYKVISSIEDIRTTFETTFNRDGSVLLCVHDGSFFSDTDMILTKIKIQTPLANTFVLEIGNLNVKLNQGVDNLLSTTTLKFNDPESDGYLVPIVGW